ncbi:unnamed protein product [Brassica rapa]|uniref:Uncharacterized protein n=1 Tax=Brassica campestris TaxID=3711 RepID=A0A3P5Z8F3_BRACM|nr:unnamed protein product [Brassica rapa]VDC72185.1 unnamed protein product [Brassica rapa]
MANSRVLLADLKAGRCSNVAEVRLLSQGQSIKQVALYLSRPVFSHGQLYVALSRVTTPEGLKILDDSEGTPRKTLLLILSTERYSAISRPVSHLQPNPDQYTST